jgi:hypothetical protein
MLSSGRVVFGQMDEVMFGQPACEAVSVQAKRLGAARIFLMVSNSLNQNTDEIDKVRRVLGNRCVGTFDRMPQVQLPMGPRPSKCALPTVFAQRRRSIGCDR